MKPTIQDIALLCLTRKKQGNWEEAKSQIGAEMLTRFETLGYLRRCDDTWQITNAGTLKSLQFVFSCDCF